MQKRFTGMLVLILAVGLLLLGTTAYADILIPKGLDTTVKLITGSTITYTVHCRDLDGTDFENYLIDLKYDPEILGEAKIIADSAPDGWIIYQGIFGDGRITLFAADETAQNPNKKDFTIDIDFRVIGVSKEDVPFTTTLVLSGATANNLSKTADDSVKMILQGGIPIGTVFTVDGNKYEVIGKKDVAFKEPDKTESNVTIPASVAKNGLSFRVTKVAEKAFSKNTTVKKVTIGQNVKTIGAKAFAGAYQLSSVSGNSSLVTIENSAFSDCSALKSFAFNAKLTTIGKNAFENCQKLAKCTLDENVTSVGAKAFYNCSGMKTLDVISTDLASGSSIGKNAFKGTPNRMKVNIYVRKRADFEDIQDMLIRRGVSGNAKFKQIK